MTTLTAGYTVDELRHLWRTWAKSGRHDALQGKIANALLGWVEATGGDMMHGSTVDVIRIECTDERQRRMFEVLADTELDWKYTDDTR